MSLRIFLFLFPALLIADSYYIQAGESYGLDPQLIWAIAYKESRHKPDIVSKPNTNGTYDIGIMQINSSHLPRLKKLYGIEKKHLFDPRTNIFVGAEILKMCFDKHGHNTQNGISCYNGRIKNNPYGKEVLKILTEAREKYQNKGGKQ